MYGGIRKLIKTVGKTLAQAFNPPPINLVYTDQDTICLRTSRGRDVTFTLSPNIDRDRFFANLKKVRHPYQIMMFEGSCVLSYYIEEPLSVAGANTTPSTVSANIVTGAKVGSSKVARDLKISHSEFLDMTNYARRYLINWLVKLKSSP